VLEAPIRGYVIPGEKNEGKGKKKGKKEEKEGDFFSTTPSNDEQARNDQPLPAHLS
jgi:hypothetical protein